MPRRSILLEHLDNRDPANPDLTQPPTAPTDILARVAALEAASRVRHLIVTLTHAQILALNSGPVSLKPATVTLDYVGTVRYFPIVIDARLMTNTWPVAYTDGEGFGARGLGIYVGSDLGFQIASEHSTTVLGLGNTDIQHLNLFTDPTSLDAALYDDALVMALEAGPAISGGASGNTLTVALTYLLYDTANKTYLSSAD